MKLPDYIRVLGRRISVIPQPTPIAPAGTDVDGEELFITGQYDPLNDTIKVYDAPGLPTIAGHNFVHEVIEAIDRHGDLKMNHTQISTLSSALYAAFSDSGVSFAEAA